MLDGHEAVKAMIEELINVARDETVIEEKRLGRRLTDAEVARIAAMVERQFHTAMAIARL